MFRWRLGHAPTTGMAAGTTTLHDTSLPRITRVALVAPGGSGKTRTACAMLDAVVRKAGPNPPPNYCVFIAHLTPLIDQCSRALVKEGIEAHGVIQAKHPRYRPWAPIQVASRDTLLAQARRGKLLVPAPKFIIVDEAHTAASEGYVRILHELYPGAFVIGLTASPWRLDGQGLKKLFQAMVVGATYKELFSAGYIVPPRAFVPPPPSMQGVKLVGGDYDTGEASERYRDEHTIGDVIAQWKLHGENRPSVYFTCDIEHSKALTRAFVAAGVPSEHIDGTMPYADLRAIEGRVQSGETRIITNCSKLREGWDLPIISCVGLTRPTKSLSLYIQQAVRGDRSYPGKTDFVLLDHAGCVLSFGLPTDDRPWSLEDRDVEERDGGAPVKGCPACYAACPAAAKVCHECGHVFAAAAAEPEEPKDQSATGAQLVEFQPWMAKQEPLPWAEEDMARLRVAVKRPRQPSLPSVGGSYQSKPWTSRPSGRSR